MVKIKYILFHLDDLEALEPYSDAERGRLLTALLRYGKTGELEKISGNERFIFPMMKARLDREYQNYKEKCTINAENGKNGGAPKGNQNARRKQSKTSETTENNPTVEKTTETTEELKNKRNKPIQIQRQIEIQRQVQTEGKIKTKQNIFAAYAAGDIDLLAALQGFEEMRIKIKKPMTDRAKTLLLGELQKLSANRNEQIEILNQSVARCWQGVFPLKDSGNNFHESKKPSQAQNSSIDDFAEVYELFAREENGG